MSVGISVEMDISVGLAIDAGEQETKTVASIIASNVMVFMSRLKVERLTVCVIPACSLRGTGRWAGVDNAWEQEKLEAKKMLENAAESHLSSACFVRRISILAYF
jgi:hypothetical protein